MRWWVADYLEHFGSAFLLSWVVWVLGSIILHELAHGFAAIRCGDQTPIATGHMTWNPLVHMGGMSLFMFALVGIAWGQMPVDPSRFRRRTDDAVVALAGPAMNLLLALLALVLGSLFIAYAEALVPERAYLNLNRFFTMGVSLNLVLLIFNLIPLPPLDGSTILRTYSGAYERMIRHPQFGTTALVLFMLVLFKLFPHIWALADHLTRLAFRGMFQLLPGA